MYLIAICTPLFQEYSMTRTMTDREPVLLLRKARAIGTSSLEAVIFFERVLNVFMKTWGHLQKKGVLLRIRIGMRMTACGESHGNEPATSQDIYCESCGACEGLHAEGNRTMGREGDYERKQPIIIYF